MESMVREQEKQDFYPRPPRGGRPNSPPEEILCKVISIHALREEGDFQNGGIGGFNVLFLSTPSARRATFCRRYCHSLSMTISIHALREEGDL